MLLYYQVKQHGRAFCVCDLPTTDAVSRLWTLRGLLTHVFVLENPIESHASLTHQKFKFGHNQ